MPENFQFIDRGSASANLLNEVSDGLSQSPKRLAPKFFYDQKGSELFDQICSLEEYYQTRTELSILKGYCNEIAQVVGENAALVDLGSGTSEKAEVFLGSLKNLRAYVPVDISGEFLKISALRIARQFPQIPVYAVCHDYSNGLDLPEEVIGDCKKVFFFPGSTIGNMEPTEAGRFLKMLSSSGRSSELLIGVDLKKDPKVIHRAYNDSKGTTAAFNENILSRISRELKVEIDPKDFDHHALYHPEFGRIEMWLISRRDLEVCINGKSYAFKEGEGVKTEHSYKYTLESFNQIASEAGFERKSVWTDEKKYFSVQYFASK